MNARDILQDHFRLSDKDALLTEKDYRLADVSVVCDRSQLRTCVDIIGGPCHLLLKGSQHAVP